MIYDICIIGAGAVGSMLARELSKYHLSICLLDKENDASCGATKANSAIVHGGFDPEPNTLKAKLNVRGISLLEKAAKELNVPYVKNGSLVVAFGDKETPELFKLMERGKQNGVFDLEFLNGDAARNIEPHLSKSVTSAMLSKNAAIISPYELAIAAVGNAMDNGVVFLRNFEVSDIKLKEDIFTVTSITNESVFGRYVINCAGGYSDKIAEMIGEKFFDIIPRAGEYMLLDKAEGARIKHTIFRLPDQNGKGILVTPTVDGNLLTGPTASKVDSYDSTETTKKGLDLVRNSALKTIPSIDFSKVITSFCGVRASTSGGDFIIQPSDKVKNFIHCAGIDSPGLTSCAAIAEYVIDILSTMMPKMNLKDDWNPIREDTHAFRKMSDEDKSKFIKSHPTYGHIVCRCELISEGEIIDALTRNPAALDFDGVKRRTRSGMGRCHGGFCTPHVMHLIADAQKITMEKVTKKGLGSEILKEKV